MLGRLFGRKSGDSGLKPGPQLGMPAFRFAEGPDPTDIVRAWKELFPKVGVLRIEGVTSPKDSSRGVVQFAVDGRSVMFAHISMPIPAGDIDSACERSWMWNDAAEAMKNQKSHAIVAAVPDQDPVGAAMAASRVIAAACKAGDPVGVYWGNSGQVHKPAFFIDAMQTFDSDGMLPVMIWIGTTVSGTSAEGPFSLSTLGMRSFGHREFEVIDSHEKPGDLCMRVYDAANYVLSSGPVLKHGDTFGESDTERIRIEHDGSKFRKGERVIRLHIP